MKARTGIREVNIEKNCNTKEQMTNHYGIKAHITEEQIRNMLRRQLPSGETEQIQKHLAQCTYCADLFAKVMEQGCLVSPPPDMKAHILKKSQNVRRRKEYSKKMQLFFYSLRVGVAMCFVLILLFATENKQFGIKSEIPKEKAGSQLELLNNINQNINEVTTKMITMEGKKNDTEKE